MMNFNKCVDCIHRVYLLGDSGCTHRRGGHTIKYITKESCIHFKCQWCNQNRCRCRKKDFY